MFARQVPYFKVFGGEVELGCDFPLEPEHAADGKFRFYGLVSKLKGVDPVDWESVPWTPVREFLLKILGSIQRYLYLENARGFL